MIFLKVALYVVAGWAMIFCALWLIALCGHLAIFIIANRPEKKKKTPKE